MSSAVVLIAAFTVVPACDARSDKSEAASAQPHTAEKSATKDAKAEASAFDRPILVRPPQVVATPARTFKHYGVGPTVDTGEEPTSSFDLDTDTASYGLAQAAVAAGKLPAEASVRVEAFLAAIGPAAPSQKQDIAIEADAVASPQREGYELLRIDVRAPAADRKPIEVVFGIDATGAMREAGQLDQASAAVVATAGALQAGDRMRVVALGPGAKELVPLGPAPTPKELATALNELRAIAGKKPSRDLGVPALYKGLSAAGHVVVLSTGVLPDGSDTAAIATTVASQAAEGRRTWTLGVGDAPYDDIALETLAHAGRGQYGFLHRAEDAVAVLAAARRPVVAIAPRVTVHFDPAAVSLYRLIGYESRAAARADAGPGGSVLSAGDAATALYELKLAADAPPRWGKVELHYRAPKGDAAKSVRDNIEGLVSGRATADAGPDMLLAVVAAATAEKLRGSYWSRTLTWDALTKLHARLPANLRKRDDIAGLGTLVQALAKLDQRGDRFESLSPQARMDFDRLPVFQ